MKNYDCLRFDGGKAQIAELQAGGVTYFIHLPSVSMISTRVHNLEECTEVVSMVIDGANTQVLLNCDVYDELIDAWLFCKGDNRPSRPFH